MLTKMDEYPTHQLPTTFDHVVSSDPRWFDRYWFASYHPRGEVGLATGIGVYRNMNVLDGYACIIHGGRQYNLRLSRELHYDRDLIGVGPLRYEIIEGLKRIRLVLERNKTGAEFDIEWEAVAPAHEENHHFQRVNGRILQDYTRFDQVGCAGGFLIIAGNRYEASKSNWWGIRDHSWGIRPGVGGPQHNGSQQTRAAQGEFVWLTFRAGPYRGYYQMAHDTEGRRLSFDGQIGRVEEPSLLRLQDVEQSFEFFPGTHGRVKNGDVTLIDESGKRWICHIEKMAPAWDILGWGYSNGYNDGLGLGASRGDYVEEADVWDISHPETIIDLVTGKQWMQFYRENAVRVTLEGAEGAGEFAHSVGPRYVPYGFM